MPDAPFVDVGVLFWYVVTAAHVIEEIHRKPTGDGEIYLRLNRVGEGTALISTRYEDWIQHPDRGNDVAVYRWPLDGREEFNHEAWPAPVQLLDDIRSLYGVGPGDEVFFTGLFYKFTGRNRNTPIVRRGTWAATADEPIYLPAVHATIRQSFLSEARSIGGLSGSPVFAHIGHWRMIGDEEVPTQFHGKTVYWMGMIHGAARRSRPGLA